MPTFSLCFRAATVIVLVVAPGGAQARQAASPVPVDCAAASVMMERASKAPPSAMTGEIDRDTLGQMQMHASMLLQMAQLEASCGKDAKKKAAVSQLITDSLDLVNRITRLQGSAY